MKSSGLFVGNAEIPVDSTRISGSSFPHLGSNTLRRLLQAITEGSCMNPTCPFQDICTCTTEDRTPTVLVSSDN